MRTASPDSARSTLGATNLYHILSIDGGGVRGLVACVILERLEAAHPGFLDQVDLFAGTSTGAIVALGMAVW